MEKEKKFVLGQYFTKKEIVDKVFALLLNYKDYDKGITILEPSSGTGNFVKCLKENNFNNIKECEIDENLTDNPSDFFLFDTRNKFDLIIGNPPFTKYNLKNSYYYPNKYLNTKIRASQYLTPSMIKKEKMQIEKAFILKSIKHLKDENSTIGFVLPISFFIGGKNEETKEVLVGNFSTIIIYQNDKNWFEEPIPCCFAIFTNTENYKNKVVLIYEDGKKVYETLDKSKLLTEELIPKSFLYKKNNSQNGVPLTEYLNEKIAKYKRDYNKNNVSGANILERIEIPKIEKPEDYALAVVRVGNSSVGKSGLINLRKDVLNDMFFVFDFKDKYKGNTKLKERIVSIINSNQEHFKNSTIRVGSKSIKKNDILDFKIQEQIQEH